MKAIIGFILFLAVLAGLIFIGEGMFALRPFLMAETMLMVVLGTAVIVLFTFPFKTIRESVKLLFSRTALADNEIKNRACDLFHAAAHIGRTTGIIVTLYGMVLVLIDIVDINKLPVRFAIVLTALLYGFLLSMFFKSLERYVKYSRVL